MEVDFLKETTFPQLITILQFCLSQVKELKRPKFML